jgi:hypothetical protein
MRLQRLAEHALKGLVVAILLEQRQARNGSVENVIDVTSRRCTSNTGHAPATRTHGAAGKERGLSSFLSQIKVKGNYRIGVEELEPRLKDNDFNSVAYCERESGPSKTEARPIRVVSLHSFGWTRLDLSPTIRLTKWP